MFLCGPFQNLYWICSNISSVLCFGFLTPKAYEILVPQPEIKPTPFALEVEVLTTGLPEKSQLIFLTLTFEKCKLFKRNLHLFETKNTTIKIFEWPLNFSWWKQPRSLLWLHILTAIALFSLSDPSKNRYWASTEVSFLWFSRKNKILARGT